ncbi:Hypothetical predicted protein [Cloeon dipterum]|uniref:Uncharacterized protein n=1 Tax=Cloeon dipterum TaxID=197152 RepID=A0A8S1D6Y7_9INSE|nr:Hypothetical predicted protein [Cloeon dipterum]
MAVDSMLKEHRGQPYMSETCGRPTDRPTWTCRAIPTDCDWRLELARSLPLLASRASTPQACISEISGVTHERETDFNERKLFPLIL